MQTCVLRVCNWFATTMSTLYFSMAPIAFYSKISMSVSNLKEIKIVFGFQVCLTCPSILGVFSITNLNPSSPTSLL